MEEWAKPGLLQPFRWRRWSHGPGQWLWDKRRDGKRVRGNKSSWSWKVTERKRPAYLGALLAGPPFAFRWSQRSHICLFTNWLTKHMCNKDSLRRLHWQWEASLQNDNFTTWHDKLGFACLTPFPPSLVTAFFPYPPLWEGGCWEHSSPMTTSLSLSFDTSYPLERKPQLVRSRAFCWHKHINYLFDTPSLMCSWIPFRVTYLEITFSLLWCSWELCHVLSHRQLTQSPPPPLHRALAQSQFIQKPKHIATQHLYGDNSELVPSGHPDG